MVTSSGKMNLFQLQKIEQQFNVALSRARDKVFLVRSFKLDDLEERTCLDGLYLIIFLIIIETIL